MKTLLLALAILAAPSPLGQLPARPVPRVVDLGGGLTVEDGEPITMPIVAPAVEPERCGRPTKKGPSCRQRVRGGGPCWRHGAARGPISKS